MKIAQPADWTACTDLTKAAGWAIKVSIYQSTAHACRARQGGEVESITASNAKFRREELNALQEVTDYAIWVAYPHAFSSRLRCLWWGAGASCCWVTETQQCHGQSGKGAPCSRWVPVWGPSQPTLPGWEQRACGQVRSRMLGRRKHLRSQLFTPSIVQSKFWASPNSASGQSTSLMLGWAPRLWPQWWGWEPCRVASVFMTLGHLCLCQLTALAGSKETLQRGGNTAFVVMQRDRAATLLSCKHHAANPTSACPHMHFLPVLGTDADVFGEFSSRPHISSVLWMIAVAPAPVLDCASLSSTAVIAITSGFANLQITIANLCVSKS